MSFDGPFFPRSRPRRVDGGIKARSARGAIGESWWSRRFLAVLESFALGSRLTRGRSYARAGQVLTLDIASGLVTASVQGSRAKPYLVRIGLEPFSARVWHAVEDSLAGQALFSARLLAGEMPAEIEEVFAAAKAPLFPGALRELRLSCTCPDGAVPCKHLAATFYLLAEAFDADPFEILHWRGRDREALLGRLRELRADAEADAEAAPTPSTMDGAERVGALAVLADVASPALTEMVDRFWLPPVPLPPRPPALSTEPDLLLRQLPTPGPALGGAALVEQLRPRYARFAEPAGGDG